MARISILFVCRANICRSPMAEGLFEHKLQALGRAREFRVDSAGVLAAPIRCRPDLRAQKTMLRHGIDISGLRSRRFTGKDCLHDLILVMDREQQEYLADAFPELDPRRVRLLLSYAATSPATGYHERAGLNLEGQAEIPDPYYGNAQGFEHVYQLLDLATEALLEQLLEYSY